jgi:hypothetical protein
MSEQEAMAQKRREAAAKAVMAWAEWVNGGNASTALHAFRVATDALIDERDVLLAEVKKLREALEERKDAKETMLLEHLNQENDDLRKTLGFAHVVLRNLQGFDKGFCPVCHVADVEDSGVHAESCVLGEAVRESEIVLSEQTKPETGAEDG